MAFLTEEKFKICGLCSQLVDESVMINSGMRNFFIEFLGISDEDLPAKTCVECYKSAHECKRFKDACDKSMLKLQRNNISSSMILGKSEKAGPASKKSEKPGPASKKKGAKNVPSPSGKKDKISAAMKSLKADAETSKKNKILESLGLDPDHIDIDVSAGRSSRSKKAFETTTPSSSLRSNRRSESLATPASVKKSLRGGVSNTPSSKASPALPSRRVSRSAALKDDTKPCKVMIKRVEKQRAERHLAKHGVVRNTNLNDRSSRKRAVIEPPEAATPPPSKRSRRGVVIEPEPSTPASPPSRSSRKSRAASPEPVRSSGRDRSANKKYVDEDASLSNKKGGKPASKSGSAKKPGPASKKKPPPPVEIISDDSAEEEEDDAEDDDEDMEEVFPTIGPYQCEICQMITDTKAEFVGHIEEKHKGVVDEEVLNSLKSDIRKSKKKAAQNSGSDNSPAKPAKKSAAASKSSPKKATPPPKKRPPPPPPKPKPKPKSKKPPPPKKKPAKPPVPPPKKRLPPPPLPDPIPTPLKKRRDRSWMCDCCDSVLSSSDKADIDRHQSTNRCKAAKERKMAAEKAVVDMVDPLGGVEPTDGVKDVEVTPVAEIVEPTNINTADDAPVVMENAEDDIDQPQHQEDNTDEQVQEPVEEVTTEDTPALSSPAPAAEVVAPEPEATDPEPEPVATDAEPEPVTADPEPQPEAAEPETEPQATDPEPEPAEPEPEPQATDPEPEPTEPEASEPAEPEPEATEPEPEPMEPEPEAAEPEPESTEPQDNAETNGHHAQEIQDFHQEQILQQKEPEPVATTPDEPEDLTQPLPQEERHWNNHPEEAVAAAGNGDVHTSGANFIEEMDSAPVKEMPPAIPIAEPEAPLPLVVEPAANHHDVSNVIHQPQAM